MTRKDLILLADDDELSREFLAEALSTCGVEVIAVPDGLAAIEALEQSAFDAVFTDLRMPGADGLAVARTAKKQDPDRPVILVTAYGTLGSAIEGVRNGADDILEKPVSIETLELSLHRARERSRLRRENRYHRTQGKPQTDLVAASPAMRSVLATVEKTAGSDAAVLICGESGCGKERVAAAIHEQSDRRDGPLVKVNAAAIPEGLIESEVFGHEAGAFTGAQKLRRGYFELADGGTLFLDEIGDMPLDVQAKLLRVVQDGEFTRVGGSRPIRANVRLVTATHRNLLDEVEAGRFREDLYYRLDVVRISVPPLRERPEDVAALTREFLGGRLELDEAALELLLQHPWPGNVRELQNVLQRAELLSSDGRLSAALLADWLGNPRTVLQPAPAMSGPASLVGRTLRDVENELILATLESCDGNRTRAAQMLGIGVRTLFDRLKRIEAQV